MRRILPAGQDALLVETGDLRHALGLYHALNAAMSTVAASAAIIPPRACR